MPMLAEAAITIGINTATTAVLLTNGATTASTANRMRRNCRGELARPSRVPMPDSAAVLQTRRQDEHRRYRHRRGIAESAERLGGSYQPGQHQAGEHQQGHRVDAQLLGGEHEDRPQGDRADEALYMAKEQGRNRYIASRAGHDGRLPGAPVIQGEVLLF